MARQGAFLGVAEVIFGRAPLLDPTSNDAGLGQRKIGFLRSWNHSDIYPENPGAGYIQYFGLKVGSSGLHSNR